MAKHPSLILACLLVAGLSAIHAQTGRIDLTIVDRADAHVPGATVVLFDEDGNELLKRKTDKDGVARWASLPPGQKKFAIIVPGFKTKLVTIPVKKNIPVSRRIVVDVLPLNDVDSFSQPLVFPEVKPN